MSVAARTAAAIFIAAAGPACAAEVIAPVDVRQVPYARAAGATHTLELQLHTFRGTRWRAEEIVEAVAAAGGVLAQCGIALATAELRTLEAPRAFHYYQTQASRELLRRLNVRKPAIFFVEDTRNQPAFDAEAIGVANAQTRPELANTVWVAHGARDLPLAIAHELVHVLTDSGEHTDAPGNLMRPETSPANSRLHAAQCERMRSRGVAGGLLRPIR